ncbi:carbon storage regulator CsrA [Thermoleophilia bacterium SCSIO 60948]|nr:carbon storage regulator CsrA [Thermoleophilia bacterium SCSIO 60948]
MLVLTRKINQSIVIGDDIEVSVLAVSRDKIRLGITAPREVPVYRKEIKIEIDADLAAENGHEDGHEASIELAASRLADSNGSAS